jgi:hypothetical protein
MNWKFWQKGSDNLGLPDFNSSAGADPFASSPGSATGLDFTQNFEAPSAPHLPPMSQGNSDFGNPGASANAFAPSSFSHADGPGPGYRPVEEAAGSHASGNLEIVIAKLDTIRAQMETINARLPVIEQRLAAIEQRLPMSVEATSSGARRPWY